MKRTLLVDSTRHDLLDRLLIAGAEELDLTPTQHARAVGHYEAVGEYLAERGSPLERYSPTVFAQGSMAIDTATKPVGRDEFDLDLMCQLLIRSSAKPAEVKRIVGERLRANDTYKKMLREKNRCWRLVYAGEFHMDIIPGIPDPQGQTATALLVPDKELRGWKETDPKGYAAMVSRSCQDHCHRSRVGPSRGGAGAIAARRAAETPAAGHRAALETTSGSDVC